MYHGFHLLSPLVSSVRSEMRTWWFSLACTTRAVSLRLLFFFLNISMDYLSGRQGECLPRNKQKKKAKNQTNKKTQTQSICNSLKSQVWHGKIRGVSLVYAVHKNFAVGGSILLDMKLVVNASSCVLVRTYFY